jgi:hypothetical protein
MPNKQGEPRIIQDGDETGRTVRAFEPLSNGNSSRKGLTATKIIYDGDRLKIYSNLLPVVAELNEGEITADVFHDFDLESQDKWYSHMGILQRALLSELRYYREWALVNGLKEKLTETDVVKIDDLGTAFDLGTTYQRIMNRIGLVFRRKWMGNPEKKLSILTFLDQDTVGGSFSFAKEFYASLLEQPRYDDDLQITKILQNKMKFCGLIRLFGFSRGQGLVWTFLESMIGDQALNTSDTESLTMRLADILDRVHFNPYSIDRYVDPLGYVFSILALIAGYQYMVGKDRLSSGDFFEEVRYRIVSPGTNREDAIVWVDRYINGSFRKMGWTAEGGTYKLRCLPIGSGDVLHFTRFDDTSVPYIPSTTDGMRNSEIDFDKIPMYPFRKHSSYNRNKTGVLNAEGAVFNRLLGLQYNMDKVTKILNVESVIPWTLARTPDDDLESDPEFWPMCYIRMSHEHLIPLVVKDDEKQPFYMKDWFEGFDSIFSGQGFRLNWELTTGGFAATLPIEWTDPEGEKTRLMVEVQAETFAMGAFDDNIIEQQINQYISRLTEDADIVESAIDPTTDEGPDI